MSEVEENSNRLMVVNVPNPWASMIVMGEMGVINLAEEPRQHTGLVIIHSTPAGDSEILESETFADTPGQELVGHDGCMLGCVFWCGMVTLGKCEDPYAMGPHLARVVDPLVFANPISQFAPQTETYSLEPTAVELAIRDAMTPDDFRKRMIRGAKKIPSPRQG